MYRKYHKFFSKILNKDFEFERFGDKGKPLMVFPCSEATFYQYKDSGMIEQLSDYIENGDIQLITVSSVDSESWYKPKKDKFMGIRHHEYENCVKNELIPYLKRECGIKEAFLATGTSWGAYHSLNFFLKMPCFFDSAVCLSGAYSLKSVIGDYYDNSVYFNDIPMYITGLNDERLLRKIRNNYLIICHGEGAWELWNNEAKFISDTLNKKNVGHWYSVWGKDYPHDWPAWKVQMRFFLDNLKKGVLTSTGMKSIIGPNRIKNKI